MANPDHIRVAGIELSSAGIKPVSGNLATLIKSGDIKDVAVRHGFRPGNPMLQLIIGAGLSLLVIYIVRDVAGWLMHGGTMTDIELLLLIPGAAGIWLLWDAFSRGYYLRINTTRGRRKIAFDKKASADNVKSFCQTLRDRKYQVSIDAVL